MMAWPTTPHSEVHLKVIDIARRKYVWNWVNVATAPYIHYDYINSHMGNKAFPQNRDKINVMYFLSSGTNL